MIYNAPIKDMLFLLNECFGVEQLRALPGNEEFDADLLEAVLEEAGRFCSTELLTINQNGDEHCAVYADGAVTTPPGFKEAYAKFVENGWTGIDSNPEHGGQGLPKTLHVMIDEMLGATNLAFKLYVEPRRVSLARQRGIRRNSRALLAEHGRRRLVRNHVPDRTTMRD